MSYQFDIRNFKSFPQFKERFLSFFPDNAFKPGQNDICWNWQGAISSSNYGSIYYGNKSYLTNRMSYMTFKGPIRSNEIVRHTCDNPQCVNPQHLILGNLSDNAIDMVKRNHQGNQKLNEECVKVIKWMLKYKPEKGLAIKLARLHGVNVGNISRIKNNKRWFWIHV
jgi:hypothetical protein